MVIKRWLIFFSLFCFSVLHSAQDEALPLESCSLVSWNFSTPKKFLEPPMRALISWDGYGVGLSKDRFEMAVDAIAKSFQYDVICIQGIPDYWLSSFDMRAKKSFKLLRLLQEHLSQGYELAGKKLHKDHGILAIFVKKGLFNKNMLVSSAELGHGGAALWVTLTKSSGKKIKIVSCYLDAEHSVKKQLDTLAERVGDLQMPLILAGDISEFGRGHVSEIDLLVDQAFKADYQWYNHRSATMRLIEPVKNKNGEKAIGHRKVAYGTDHIFYSPYCMLNEKNLLLRIQ